jgi:adhesin transport system outer membrane protein
MWTDNLRGEKTARKAAPLHAMLQHLPLLLGLLSLLPPTGAMAQTRAKATAAAAASKGAAKAAPAPAAERSPTQSQCGEEDALPSSSGRDTQMLDSSAIDPRSQLQELVDRALQRSQSLGAATLLAQAAHAEWQEARAARLPQINLGGSLNHVGLKSDNRPLEHGMQGRAILSISAPLYDFGRTAQLANWRSQLAESARLGLASAEQQLALQTVALAMDRSRYQLQAQVYAQYVRKMGCLVEALDTIVKADRGRASELVQATKNKQQAELAVQQTDSALAQVETQLRRFVGDQLPRSAVYSALLIQVPDLSEMQRDVALSPEVGQLDAQAKAQASYAESVAAGYKPQINVIGTSTAMAGMSKGGEWSAGLSVSMPLYNATAEPAISAARKRAQAAVLQREDGIEARRYRIADIHESAVSSFDRARRIVDILRNSDRLRASTLQQWQQLGRRSLFDVMGSEADYFSLRVAHVNALFDGQQAVAMMWSMGRGVLTPIR